MDEYSFDCPACAQTITVNEGMRDAIIDHGCPVCGESVTESAFSRPDGYTQNTNG